MSDFWQNAKTVISSFPHFWPKLSRHRACGAALSRLPFRARAKRHSGQRRAARAVAGHFLRKCRKPEIAVFAFCQKSDKVHPPLYIGGARVKTAKFSRVRERQK